MILSVATGMNRLMHEEIKMAINCNLLMDKNMLPNLISDMGFIGNWPLMQNINVKPDLNICTFKA